ncbi:MAG: phosphoadenylyl-sulfate reductase [Deltaproteobacteria bacterium]|nr:phosphoadenylyl-sulfate reductase [Deltaproteobacteria bacterium]
MTVARMPRDRAESLVATLRDRLAQASPVDVLRAAHDAFGGDAAISFSGAEDVALLGLCRDAGVSLRVFCLDTGRLHPETYLFLETCRGHFGAPIEVYFPEPAAVQRLVTDKGLFSFRTDGHKECCSVRKVEPLRRALAGAPAWITGQRRDQSPDTRADVPVVQLDEVFGGHDGRALVKFNPLANWTSAKVWKYIRAAELPYNPLHERGFVSIGCEPCTRPVLPGQHEREGRWWWEEATRKECGLHAANLDNAAL